MLIDRQAVVATVGHYENQWLDVDFVTPKILPGARLDAQLVLKLDASGKVLSTNSYDIIVASPEWANPASEKNRIINVLNPTEQTARILSGLLLMPVSSMSAATAANPLVICDWS